jgi:hypothetical protein
MKKTLLLVSLIIFSNTSFALDDMNSSQMMSYIAECMLVGIASQYGVVSIVTAKEAAYVVNDIQDYAQTNEMSALLQQKVNELKAVADISEEDAVDLILENSLQVLKNK